MFDCYGPVAGSHEHEIQNLSPGSSVAVREWMDVLEHRVESGSFEDRVVFGTVHRVHERFHVLVDFKWVGGLHSGGGDPCLVAVGAEPTPERGLHVQCGDFMQLLDHLDTQRPLLFSESFRIGHAIRNATGSEDVSCRRVGRHELALQHQFGVLKRQRGSLDRVGVVDIAGHPFLTVILKR